MSESALVAAIRPQSYGVVDDRREEVGGQHEGRAAVGRGHHRRVVAVVQADQQRTVRAPAAALSSRSPATTASSSPGGILHAHPPPWAYCVRRTGVDGRSEVLRCPCVHCRAGDGVGGRTPAASRRPTPCSPCRSWPPPAERLGRPAVKADHHRRPATGPAAARSRRGEVAGAAIAALPAYATSLRRVINATGVIIHTNLGRAPLSPAARDALGVAAGATDVEFDLATGQRARRGRGALAALAAAVPARRGGARREQQRRRAAAVRRSPWPPAGRSSCSRGELVEIGDGFRIPDLLTLGRRPAARGRHDQPVLGARLRRRDRAATRRSS